MNKDVEYYMSLPYPILLTPAPKTEELGWYAQIPLLGEWKVDGATQAEALETLEKVKRVWFEIWLEDGDPIPEPESITA